MEKIFIINGLTEGQKVKHARIAKGLRQIDVASLAKVNPEEVTSLEKDRFVRTSRKNMILKVLGLIDDQPEDQHGN